MFESDVSRDEAAKTMTRRVFVGGGVAAVVGLTVWMRMSPGVEASTEVHGTPGQVTIVNFGDDGTRLGVEAVAKVVKTDGEWRRQLGANSYGIARLADTEMPFSGNSLKEHRSGVFRCGTPQWGVPVPGVRDGAVQLEDEVRFRYGVAELLGADRKGEPLRGERPVAGD